MAVIDPPTGLDLSLGAGCRHVVLTLHPAVAAVVREALAAEAVVHEVLVAGERSSGWSEAEANAMELVIAAIEAEGIRGCL